MLETRTLKNLKDVIDAAGEALKHSGEVWWRGESRQATGDSKWKLLPRVLRDAEDLASEKDRCCRFHAGGASRYRPVPDWEDWSGWLFLMQHYGLPTRLLDWTAAALVATFFSVEKDPVYGEPEQEGTLWGLAPHLYNERYTGKRGIFSPDEDFVKPLFRYPFLDETEIPDKNYALVTRETDIRMLVQLSRFTIHGSTTALEEEKTADQYLWRFRIPADDKEKLRRQLMAMGVRRSLIFPDLENLAKELAQRRFEKPAAGASDGGSRPASEAEEPSQNTGAQGTG